MALKREWIFYLDITNKNGIKTIFAF